MPDVIKNTILIDSDSLRICEVCGWYNIFDTGDCSCNADNAAHVNDKMRKVLSSDNQTIRLHMGELTAQEMRTVRAAFNWVLSVAGDL